MYSCINTSSVYCIMCSPPQVKSTSIIIYPPVPSYGRPQGTELKDLYKQALTSVVQLVWCHPTKQKGSGSIPGQGTCLGCRFSPQSGRLWEMGFSLTLMFLSFSFFLPSPLYKNKTLKKKICIYSCRQSLDTVQYSYEEGPQISQLITCHLKTTEWKLKAAERF